MSVFHKLADRFKRSKQSLPAPNLESYDTDLRKAIPSAQQPSPQKTTYILSPPPGILSSSGKKTTVVSQEIHSKSGFFQEANTSVKRIILLALLLMSLCGYWLQKDSNEPIVEENTLGLHSVKAGDTLWSLSCFYYGSPYFWKEIFLANQEELRSSGKLVKGMILWIPESPEKRVLQRDPLTTSPER